MIAQSPLADRASSRLLHIDRRTGEISDRMFADAPSLFREGDVLIWNDTRVTALRLFGYRPTGAAVEALLLRETGERTFAALVKPGKRLKPGSVIEFQPGLVAKVTQDLDEPLKELQFEPQPGWEEKLAAHGLVPLPPYIRRALNDPERYQTVYSRAGGSAAAPTAGLHFTPEIIEEFRNLGVETAQVTLDVGLDTFRPITSDDLSEHPMHGETCRVSEETAELVRRAKGRIVAVGTTTARTLESFAAGKRSLDTGQKSTRLFIRPGYEWRIVDGMFTNFHMPRTTMLAMISALAGRDTIMRAYSHAVAENYRFLSFGDSMLIL